ncbi:MAG: GntR family transcriptional regulator [Thalassovita sp.]|nr:GntR family transcriptional regulator [Thalassovita sp.]
MSNSGRNSRFDKALMGLRTLVLRGEYAANARLPETTLSERLGISRTPLRQAMNQLIEEGLLERIATGGCRVARFTIEEIEDAIEIRGVIEGTAARLAAERGMAPELAKECRQVLARLDEALSQKDTIDFEDYVRFNARFHELVGAGAGSNIVSREVERASRLPLASPSAFMQGQELIPDFQVSLRQAQTQHKAIFEAIENKEGTRAEALTREHARLARKNLEFVTRAKPDLIHRVPGLALIEA